MSKHIEELVGLSKLAREKIIRLHQRSRTGHIGGNLSCIDMLLAVRLGCFEVGDKLILSKGHAAGALYVALNLAGVLQDELLETFYQDATHLPAHPPIRAFTDIPFGTGSLGHGLSLACGMAMARKLTKSQGRVYCICSDGEWQEGSTWEALGFAVANDLDNLTVLIDANGLQGFGKTAQIWAGASLVERAAGFGASVSQVDGHDHEQLARVLASAGADGSKLQVIVCRTVKGKGVSFMEDRMEWHYLPMNDAQVMQALAEVQA